MFCMRRSVSTAAALLAAALVLAASLAPRMASADVTLAADAGDGGVAAYGDVIAWSRWDRAAAGYRLVVRRAGRTAVLPVAPSTTPFGVSAGPGPEGSVWLVWSRCSREANGCDVVRYDLDDPGERPVAVAARPGVGEFSPAIWRRQIVFARRTATGTAFDTAVMIAPVTGGRARPAAAVPATTCGVGLSDGCERRALRGVNSLALRGSKLLVASAVDAGIGICGFSTVRWVDLRTRDARQIASAVCGLSGAGFGSTTFDDHGDAWYVKLCPGDPDPCLGERSGPFRYDPGSGRTTRLETQFGSRLRAVGLARKTAVVMASTGRLGPDPSCELTAEYGNPSEQCQIVTTISPQRFTSALTRTGGDVPPPGYRSVRRTRQLGLLRPPPELPCIVANPAPQQRPVLWAGARAVDANGRQRRFPKLAVTARGGGRTVRGTVPAQTRNVEGWSFTSLALGQRAACGRTWTLIYRPPGLSPTSYRTRVLRP
jgi:hypothetical protein